MIAGLVSRQVLSLVFKNLLKARVISIMADLMYITMGLVFTEMLTGVFIQISQKKGLIKTGSLGLLNASLILIPYYNNYISY